MTEERIRLRYSGFIMFLSRLISVGTGLLFVLIVTRNITTEEFGVFGNTSDILGYFTLAATVIPFWTTRFLTRKNPGVPRTGLTANVIISAAFTLAYLLLLSTITSLLRIKATYTAVYVIASLQIVESYAISELEAILQARHPHTIGFGFLVFEACKVVVGFVLIIGFGLGLLGAVAGITIAYTMQVMFYLKLTSSDLQERARWSYIKEWIKASPINLYTIIGQRLVSFVLILLFAYGGELARAYYGAASTIASVVGYSSLLAFALYPSLLSRKDSQDIVLSVRMVSMFTIAMTVGAVILSDSYLTILSPTYRITRPVLILLSVSNACLSLSYVFGSIVTGSEELEAEGKIDFGRLVKSRLFLLFSLPYIEIALTMPSTYLALTTMVKDAIGASTALAFITLVVNIVMLLARYLIAEKCMEFRLPWRSVAKYAAASAVMGAILYVIPSPTRLSATLALTLFGGIVYFAVLSAIDRDTRGLVRSAEQALLELLK